MRLILDAEFDSLTPKICWCVVTKDIDTGKEHVFLRPFTDLPEHIKSAKLIVGHNILSFDVPNLRSLSVVDIDEVKCIDTLVCSRLFEYGKNGGHSVKNWGQQFELTKKFIDVYDDPKRIDDYVERCIYDVRIQLNIFKELEKQIYSSKWRKALRVEHDMELICRDMTENGFGFNWKKSAELLDSINAEMAEMENTIKSDLPPVLRQIGVIKLRRKQDGTPTASCSVLVDDADFLDGNEFHRIQYHPFDPASPKQRIELLNRYGWKPVEKTKGHLLCQREIAQLRRKMQKQSPRLRQLTQKKIDAQKERLERFKIYGWKISETNLATVPTSAPDAVHLFAAWLCLEGRRADLEEWRAAYNKYTGSIHGSFNGIGSWTHRMSHARPNQGNIFGNFTIEMCKDNEHPTRVEAAKVKYNGPLRSCWKARGDRILVGTDAEGIQMRIFAHYVNDPNYIKAIVSGDKKLGTDIHSYNRSLLGEVCRSRDDSKTFIYAWLLGASAGKVGEILGCSLAEAKASEEKFQSSVPGIENLKCKIIPVDARNGYFVGLDGRIVLCSSEHLMLAGYLQNGEACVMKHANVLWRKWARESGIPFWQVDFVHDEWQTEARNMEEAKELGRLQELSIVKTGENLGLNIALAGEAKYGINWLETH